MLKKTLIVALCFLALNACSSDDDDSSTALATEDSERNDSPAATLAQNFINNGFYLSRTEEFSADGSLVDGSSYTLNTDENIIEARKINNDAVIDTVFTYNESGDLTSVAHLSTSGLSAPIGDDVVRGELDYIDGVLQAINVENLVGREEDYQSLFSYNTDGTIASIGTTRLETNRTDESTFNYENGVLQTVMGNDFEVPELTFVSTITRNAQGRVSSVQTIYDNPPDVVVGPELVIYLYDEDGNVAEQQLQDEDGGIVYRQVFTYLPASENVFNLNNFNIYYSQ